MGIQKIYVFLEPRRGWTKKVVEYVDKRDKTQCRALFTGPYGVSVPTRKYGIVLLVASDFGIVAHFSYLTQLIYNYNARRAYTRRIRLVWQVETSGKSTIYLPSYSCLQYRPGIPISRHIEPSVERGCAWQRPSKCKAVGVERR